MATPAKKPAPKKKPAKAPKTPAKGKATPKPTSRASARTKQPQTPIKHKGRHAVDWDAVHRDYRTGKYTNIELGKMHGCNPDHLSRRVTGEGWTKDLREVVAHATRAAVIKHQVDEAQRQAQGSAVDAVTIAASINAEVIERHRGDIIRVRAFGFDLMKELQEIPDVKNDVSDALSEIRRIASAPLEDETAQQRSARLDALAEQQGRIRKAVYEAAEIHARVGSLHKVTDMLTKLQTLERKAHDLDRADQNPSGFENLLDQALA